MKLDLGAIPYVTRVKTFVLALLVLNAFCTNLTHVRYNLGFVPRAAGEDDSTVGEGRFEELRKALPAPVTVGYVHDRADQTEAMNALVIAQYALAPNIVVRETEPELVVGDFSRPGAETEMPAGVDLITVQDFGNGVVVFGREGK